MKIFLFVPFLLMQMILSAQSPENIQKNFIDSLMSSNIIGKTIPSFILHDKKGKLYTNKCLYNKITFINFWFEACAPCIAEMDALEELYKEFKNYENFQFWSITFENKEAIRKIGKKYKMSYPIFSTTRDSCSNLSFNRGFPTSIILNQKGEIIFFNAGGPIDPAAVTSNFKKEIYPAIKQLLAGNISGKQL